ncbi:hypothetical protein KC367_g23 [Hortaea werneckii]|nr:hypothetical protein KC367_g23 [Hortaea werneckii]
MALRNPRGMYLHAPTLRHRLVSHREVDDRLRASTLSGASESKQLIGEKSLKIATRLTMLVVSGPVRCCGEVPLTTSPLSCIAGSAAGRFCKGTGAVRIDLDSALAYLNTTCSPTRATYANKKRVHRVPRAIAALPDLA